jgi:ribose-phosphate pyrophosphokinase
VLYKHLKEMNLPDLVVVSPDVGGMKMAYSYAQMLRADLAIVAKRRVSGEDVEALYVVGEVEGKNVLLVDDMTETAGTLTAAARILKKQGAKRILAGVSHTILNDKAVERLQKSSIDELITTNSVPPREVPNFKLTAVSVAALLGEGILRVHNAESVSSLFEINNTEKL